MDKISVIVPVYKVEPYLRRCIDSILQQSYRHFELILVDDGSPDACGAICDEYAQADARVVVIHQTNQGLSAARNAGIDWVFAHSDSQWMSFIDSDDWVHPRYLELILECAHKDGTQVVIGAYLETSGEALPGIENIENSIWKPEEFFLKHWVNATVAWGKLYSRTCFSHMRYPVGKIHEDEFVTYQILLQQRWISAISNPLYAYYQNDAGITRSHWTPKRLDALEAIEMQIDFFEKRCHPELARTAFFSFLYLYRDSQKQLFSCAMLSDSEKAHSINSLRKQLRSLLIKYRKYKWFSPWMGETERDIYTDAFPCLRIMRGFWRVAKATLKHIPFARSIWHVLRRLPEWNRRARVCIRYLKSTGRSSAVLLQTPLHGNLGDHAIALSELELMGRLGILCADFPRIEGAERWCSALTPKWKTVFITGGGFFGELWPYEEQRVRDTLMAYRNNRIIVFPHTVFFDLSTPVGRKCLEESRQIYRSHPNLTIFLRERYSYEFMLLHMPEVHIELVPDMVMLLEPRVPQMERRGALLCLRQDLEKTLSDEEREKVTAALRSGHTELRLCDTVLHREIDPSQRQQAVHEKLCEFASAKLVVTDRLHGMIFAAITETPCIVLNSRSYKLRGCYEWLSHLDYIRFAEDLDSISGILRELEQVKPKYDRTRIERAIEPLNRALLEIRGKKPWDRIRDKRSKP